MITVLSSLTFIVLIAALILLNIVVKCSERVVDRLKENIEHHRIKLKCLEERLDQLEKRLDQLEGVQTAEKNVEKN